MAEETFAAAGNGVPLAAFEQYIRGITEPDQAERLRHLEQAVKLSPEFGAAWMALGREDYNGQQYQEAAEAFAKVDRNGPDGLEADFYRGLSLMFSGDYAHAEQAFAEVARVLPLAEVVNNEGVAVSRQGKDGTSLFIQAAAADPNAADYHFNLAVSLKRHGNLPGALNELAQCLKLRPNDSEALGLEEAWKGKPAAGGNGRPDANADPLERIVRRFDAAAFRQAAAMLDEMNAGRLAALTPRDRARALCTQAKGFWIAGCCWRRSGCIRMPWPPTARARRRMPAWLRCANAAAMPRRRARRLTRRWNWALRPMRILCWRSWILRRARWARPRQRPGMR